MDRSTLLKEILNKYENGYDDLESIITQKQERKYKFKTPKPFKINIPPEYITHIKLPINKANTNKQIKTITVNKKCVKQIECDDDICDFVHKQKIIKPKKKHKYKPKPKKILPKKHKHKPKKIKQTHHNVDVILNNNKYKKAKKLNKQQLIRSLKRKGTNVNNKIPISLLRFMYAM